MCIILDNTSISCMHAPMQTYTHTHSLPCRVKRNNEQEFSRCQEMQNVRSSFPVQRMCQAHHPEWTS